MAHTASRGPGRPPSAKAADTRERIVHAARGVFSELGYEAATFQAIAIRADLTRPAINHYFADKRILWRGVIEQAHAKIVSAGIASASEQTTLINRLSAFLAVVMQLDAEDRSAAAFLVTSVLEAQRHPELNTDEHDPLKNSRAFVTWAVDDAIARGELSAETDVGQLVEMLVAIVWGMGFYAGFLANPDEGSRQEQEASIELAAIAQNLELLLANRLWKFSG